MLGAIVGDIVGSQFEHTRHTSKDFSLFSPGCRFTDDTVLTAAVCEALLACGKDLSQLPQAASCLLAHYADLYWQASYGAKFNLWRLSDDHAPYFSCGNGAAMRVSGCAYAAETIEEVFALADAVTAVTHNHPEGIKGARAVAACIFLARRGSTKEKIKAYVQEHFYDLSFTLDEIRPTYARMLGLNTCQKSVPQALQCFFESVSFEDALRNAVSLGGDSDTLAAMAASVADAYYGIPEEIAEQAAGFLDERLASVLCAFEARYRAPQAGAKPLSA